MKTQNHPAKSPQMPGSGGARVCGICAMEPLVCTVPPSPRSGALPTGEHGALGLTRLGAVWDEVGSGWVVVTSAGVDEC